MTPIPYPAPRFIRGALTTVSAAAALTLAGCATAPGGNANPSTDRTATIQRTANGVPHISAPDLETLAYGVAYAQAQDNVCQTAEHMVTVRGERSRWFGPTQNGLLGRRMLPNEQIDLFVTHHINDAALASAWSKTSADAQALNRGYVAGYNRFLADNATSLPAACKGQPWVTPISLADLARASELAMTQASLTALADAVVGAQPPAKPAEAAKTSRGPDAPAATPSRGASVNLADAAQALREMGLLDSPLGSNAWAFGKDTAAGGRGVLVGNPHFPWAGVNRFWQMHVTVPGVIDSMGAATGQSPIPSIGFNKDVAWTHTVSTGKRFTLHELTLVADDPTSYIVDGQPVKMQPREVRITVRGADGQLGTRSRTLWSTRWGPVVVVPRAGLTWNAKTAYSLKDANAGNTRFLDAWLTMNKARNVEGLRDAHRTLGIPWVNTIAADRNGQAMYADISVVPDVDAAQLARCAPSPQAAALRGAAGLVVLNGSRSDCDWRADPSSAVPGLTPLARMPVAIRSDWVHNSNDSFVYTHPAQRFEGISPMVGDAQLSRPRTRAGLVEVPELAARGKVTPEAALAQLFQNRNFMAGVVLPDLLAACAAGKAPDKAEVKDGCQALASWSRRNEIDARGAHLFREFWRTARAIPGVHRVAFDPAQPVATPTGLKLDDTTVGPKVWDALAAAVVAVRKAGFALDATLGSVQRPLITDEAIALHGGDEFEGVLNNLGNQFAPGINAQGLRIDYGTSYLQAVTFDDRGPVARAVLTYGQSTNPASPHANDQLRLFSRKEVPLLPFHPEDVAKARVGDTLRLTRP